MGILLVVGMMAYSVGLCLLFGRFGAQASRPGQREPTWDRRAEPAEIPDYVPVEWVEQYRAEHGG
jgi:hypothetical protein